LKIKRVILDIRKELFVDMIRLFRMLTAKDQKEQI
jgi:hypothetical protein